MTTFGTAGIRGDVRSTVTAELALAVGRTVGLDADLDQFVVGRDGRETGDGLASALVSGLLSAGADVERLGTVPTPALAYASVGRRGVMLTASHNPPTDNGIKLFADGVEYRREDERRIEDGLADVADAVPWNEWGDSTEGAVLHGYRSSVAEYAAKQGGPVDDLSIAVDCGNGMAGLATPQVLTDLGADVTALNANVDGGFPARGSKPTPTSLGDLREFVRQGGFEFGIGHDGDADRIAIVGPDGDMVHEDTVVAILAEHYVSGSDAVDPVVVTTPNASGRIDERVEVSGGRTERVRLGALHEGVDRVEADGGTVVFAAEPWKHIHPDFGGWIDGVLSAAVLAELVADAGNMATLREPITEHPYRKTNVACPDDRKEAAMERVEDALADRFPDAAVDTEYGVRVDMTDGSWVLVRPSGTEPYLRVYAESEEVKDLVSTVTDLAEEAVEAV